MNECYLETSVTNYQSKVHNIPEERRFQAEIKIVYIVLELDKLQNNKREIPKCYSVMETLRQATKRKMSEEPPK